MRKLLICTPLGTFSAFQYIIYIFLIAYNSKTTYDIIKFKFSAFLSFVEVTKCVKLQSHRCTGVKVGVFRISPVSSRLMTVRLRANHFNINTIRVYASTMTIVKLMTSTGNSSP